MRPSTGAFDVDRSEYGSFWFQPVAFSANGQNVTPEAAMRLSAVFRCVSLVSGHMAMLPLRFFKAGTRKQIAHPLGKLLNRRPNRWQNAFEWREMMQAHLELRGNAYNQIEWDRRTGAITALVPLHPDRVKVMPNKDGSDWFYRCTRSNGTDFDLARGDVWHLRGMSNDGVRGMSVVDYARESFGAGLSVQAYGSRFFANDAKPTSGWVEMPGQFKDKPAREAFREQLQQAQGDFNHGRMMVLDRGMKYHEVGLTNEAAQFLETQKFKVTDIARWFGVPPHKVFDLEKATFSNIEQLAIEYVGDALQPRACRWEAAIEADLLLEDEEVEAEYDFRELERGDAKARSSYYHNAILDGWMTRNEARDMEGREPLDGLDEPLRPLNMVEESAAEDLESDAEDGEPAEQEAAEPKEPDEQARRMQAMVRSNSQRLARRFAGGSQNSELGLSVVPLIEEALCVPHESAMGWWEANNGLKDETEIAASLMRLGEAE